MGCFYFFPILVFVIAMTATASKSQDEWRPDEVIKSNANPKRGDWSSWTHCGKDNFVVGMRLNYDPRHRGRSIFVDDVGLAGVQLICSNNATISGGGLYIDRHWGKAQYCKGRSFVVGFHIFFHQKRGWVDGLDKVDAIGLRLLCDDGSTIEDGTPKIPSEGVLHECPLEHAVCGLQTCGKNAESWRTNLWPDNVGVTDVSLGCCKMADVDKIMACEPYDLWVEVNRYDNTKNDITVKFAHTKTLGTFNQTSQDKGGSTLATTRMGIKASVVLPLKMVQARITAYLSRSRTTGQYWQHTANEGRGAEESVKMQYDVPPRRMIVVEQLVGVCGDAKVYSNHFRTRSLTQEDVIKEEVDRMARIKNEKEEVDAEVDFVDEDASLVYGTIVVFVGVVIYFIAKLQRSTFALPHLRHMFGLRRQGQGESHLFQGFEEDVTKQLKKRLDPADCIYDVDKLNELNKLCNDGY
jgi:hypothetical protein